MTETWEQAISRVAGELQSFGNMDRNEAEKKAKEILGFDKADEKPTKNPCPKCGSEMKPKEACTSDGHDNSWYIVGWGCKCGYEEKVEP